MYRSGSNQPFNLVYWDCHMRFCLVSMRISSQIEMKKWQLGYLRHCIDIWSMFVLSRQTEWCSPRADAPQGAHFSTDICCVNQEGVKTLEKCAQRGASARRERHIVCLDKTKMDQISMHCKRIFSFRNVFKNCSLYPA